MRSPWREPRHDQSREPTGYKADASPAKKCRWLTRWKRAAYADWRKRCNPET